MSNNREKKIISSTILLFVPIKSTNRFNQKSKCDNISELPFAVLSISAFLFFLSTKHHI